MRTVTSYKALTVRLGVLACALIAVLLVALLTCLVFVASYQSHVAWNEQVKLASGAVEVKSEHVRRRAMDYGAWDAAVDNLVTRLDPEWADENVGKTVFLNLEMEMTVVVAPNDVVTYASIQGERSSVVLDEILSGGIRELLQKQRSGSRDDAVTGMVLAQGRPAIAGVMPIRPLEGSQNATDPHHLIVLVDVMDAAMLAEFASVYLLPDLHLLPSTQTDTVGVPVRLSDGSTVGNLAWTGADPGAELLRLMLPVWLATAVGFAVLTLILVRRSIGTSARLDGAEYKARHDILTGMSNRFGLFEHIEALVLGPAEKRRFALAYLDLDGFKTINDTFGHSTGDIVLTTTSKRLQDTAGSNAFVARLGGDEFVVIIHDVNSVGEVEAMGHAILLAIAAPIDVGERRVVIGVTIGIAFFPSDGTDVFELMTKADAALYAGKLHGKGTMRFHGALALPTNFLGQDNQSSSVLPSTFIS